MKKIVIFMDSFHRGGTEKALLSLLNKLDYTQYEVDLYFLKKEGELLPEIPAAVRVMEIPFTTDLYQFIGQEKSIETRNLKDFIYKVHRKAIKIRNPKERFQNPFYEKVLKSIRLPAVTYDLAVDFWGYGYLTTAICGKIVKAKRRATWLHDEHVEYLEWVEEYLPCLDYIIGVSRANVDAFCQKYPLYKEKARVIYNLTDVDRIVALAEADFEDERYCGKNKLLTVGRLAIEQKGLDLLVEVAAELVKRGMDFHWFIIGDGADKQRLQYLIRQNEVMEHVILLGEKENPYPYMKNCDLYVQPSRYEGYCTAVVEARALQRRIVVSDILSNLEQIQAGVNGYVASLDVKNMADVIQDALGDNQDEIKDNIVLRKLDFRDEMKKFIDLVEG